MARRAVNFVLILLFALLPTIWLWVQIRAGEVAWWLVILWLIIMALTIALTYGKEVD